MTPVYVVALLSAAVIGTCALTAWLACRVVRKEAELQQARRVLLERLNARRDYR